MFCNEVDATCAHTVFVNCDSPEPVLSCIRIQASKTPKPYYERFRIADGSHDVATNLTQVCCGGPLVCPLQRSRYQCASTWAASLSKHSVTIRSGRSAASLRTLGFDASRSRAANFRRGCMMSPSCNTALHGSRGSSPFRSRARGSCSCKSLDRAGIVTLKKK